MKRFPPLLLRTIADGWRRPMTCVWTSSFLFGLLIFAPVVCGAEPQATKPAAAPAAAPADKDGKPAKPAPEKKKPDRTPVVTAVLEYLHLGAGAAIADIGAGGGEDTWVFAKLVGSTGTVYAEEITEGKVKSLASAAEQRGLKHVRAVLGRPDDPGLPPQAVDLACMRYVYHHVTKPREMLRGIWRALKPGGHLVVIDKQRGTLRDWVPRETRGDKHHWIAETTVVREAREEGFVFVAGLEDQCRLPDDFVLVLQRPRDAREGGGDPEPFLPLPADAASRLLAPPGRPYQHPVFIALGPARELIAPILQQASGPALEIVLEEWATQKDERPPLPAGVSCPAVLTDQGDPHLGPEPIDVVFFLDSYHLLFHDKTLLAKLHERLTPQGCVYVLDRTADQPLSRREASHRRRIAPAAVKEEMAAAGFTFQREEPRPADDRFLLVFGK